MEDRPDTNNVHSFAEAIERAEIDAERMMLYGQIAECETQIADNCRRYARGYRRLAWGFALLLTWNVSHFIYLVTR